MVIDLAYFVDVRYLVGRFVFSPRSMEVQVYMRGSPQSQSSLRFATIFPHIYTNKALDAPISIRSVRFFCNCTKLHTMEAYQPAVSQSTCL